jgi:tetratricopeptide (TPR) repeat protein
LSLAGSRSKNKKKNQKRIDVRPGPGRLAPPGRLTLLLSFLLVAATLALYSPVNHHRFANYDDDEYVTDNAHVKAGLSGDTVAWAFTTYDAANWHPLTWLSHTLDYQLFQLDPGGHHDANLLLHGLNVALLFWVLWQATGYAGRSLIVAALFALHPINVESVVWVAERKNLLSLLFFLLALGAYRRYVRQPRVGRYAAVTLFYVLGLMSKPQVITLPFVLLLWDYWPLRRMAVREGKSTDATEPAAIFPQRIFAWLVKEKIPLFVLSAGSAVITMRAQRLGGGINPDSALLTRLANAIVSYARYLGEAFWPTRLAPIYPYPVGPFKAWEVAAAALLLAAITALAIVGRRHRYLLVGWFWFLGTLVPMIGLVQVGRQAMADRYAYLPFVGLFIVICWGVSDWAMQRHVPIAWQAGVSVGILLVLAALTHRQIDFWNDNVRLWTRTLQVTNGNYLAEDNLGRALQAEGKPRDAMPHFERAAEIEPSYVFAYIHMGIYQHQQGDLQGALRQYQKVISLTANDIAHYGEIRYEIFVNMASAYAGVSDFVRARECLESAVSLDPDSAEVWTNLGTMAQKTGEVERAIQAYSKAVILQPTERGYRLLAQALQQAGRQEEAQVAAQQGMALAGETGQAP